MAAAEKNWADDRDIGLDLVRAFAILLTCAMHAIWVIGVWQYGRDFELLPVSSARSLDETLWHWLYHSRHGVYMFFVLSGFLLSKRWLNGRPPQLLTYLGDRAMRILPGAWIALSVALAMRAMDGQMPDSPWLLWIENAFFLNWFRQDDLHHLLIVTWSLQAEWIFYLLLPLIGWLAARLGGYGVAHVKTLLASGMLIVLSLSLLSVRGGAYALFFLTGAVCAVKQAVWRAAVGRIRWLPILTLYSLVNLAYAWTTPTAARLQTAGFHEFEWHAIAFSILAGLIVLKAADHTFRDGMMVRLGRYIGRISYSIYLWNLLVVMALMQWFELPKRLAALSPGTAMACYLLLVVAVTWGISAISFHWIERPYFERRRAHTKIG